MVAIFVNQLHGIALDSERGSHDSDESHNGAEEGGVKGHQWTKVAKSDNSPARSFTAEGSNPQGLIKTLAASGIQADASGGWKAQEIYHGSDLARDFSCICSLSLFCVGAIGESDSAAATRPVIAYSRREDDHLKGSARSAPAAKRSRTCHAGPRQSQACQASRHCLHDGYRSLMAMPWLQRHQVWRMVGTRDSLVRRLWQPTATARHSDQAQRP